jgi:hypothetical protein
VGLPPVALPPLLLPPPDLPPVADSCPDNELLTVAPPSALVFFELSDDSEQADTIINNAPTRKNVTVLISFITFVTFDCPGVGLFGS